MEECALNLVGRLLTNGNQNIIQCLGEWEIWILDVSFENGRKYQPIELQGSWLRRVLDAGVVVMFDIWGCKVF